MNCKPGDLAYIVGLGSLPAPFNSFNGHVVQVSHVTRTVPITWRLVKPITLEWPDAEVTLVGVEDHYLTPITPPASEPDDINERRIVEDSFDPMFAALGMKSRTWA